MAFPPTMTKQNGKRRSRMASQNARLTFLRLIDEHEGEWGWYQFERAFPPGWFTDEPPTTRAKDIIDRLEMDGLVTETKGKGEPMSQRQQPASGVGCTMTERRQP